MHTIVLRSTSEAQTKRILECAEKFTVNVFLTDTVPAELLPRSIPYLGYVFIKDKQETLMQFARYAESIDKAANEWVIPTKADNA